MATEERLLRLENAYITLSDSIDWLTETQARTEANVEALTTIVGELDRKVDRLAGTVERYISEGRNGQS